MLTLPVEEHSGRILSTVAEHPVVIVTAPTGSGKSTFIPRALLQLGLRVIVTEPRRLAACRLAQYVASQCNQPLGDLVGYRTGFERCDSRATRLLYCTDELQLIRELLGQNRNRDVLILDEFHERNLSQDTLLAWVRREIHRDPWFKLIIMSATIDAAQLSAFFKKPPCFKAAPIIEIPGRAFPVTTLSRYQSRIEHICDLLRAGHNVLVFEPGKREIRATIAALSRTSVPAVILPLHADLDIGQQMLCFRHYPVPKCIVATNVAETSITIDDIDAVVDSGLKRENRVVHGVEGLYTTCISLAEEEQRKGRAGRTKPGFYVSYCPYPPEKRPPYPTPEIDRCLLSKAVLRIKADAGIPMEEIEFLDQPPMFQILEAQKSLIRLECLDQAGQVTRIGAKVNRLPVSPQLGRMIVEAERLDVVEDMIIIAAIIEADGIIRLGKTAWRQYFCPNENRSDVLAQLSVFKGALLLLENGKEDELEALGVDLTALGRAIEIRDKVRQSPLIQPSLCRHQAQSDKHLITAICAGLVDHIYVKTGSGWSNGDGIRSLPTHSVVARDSEFLVGIPWDLKIDRDERPSPPLRLIHWATRVPKGLVPSEIMHFAKKMRRKKRRQTCPRRSLRGRCR